MPRDESNKLESASCRFPHLAVGRYVPTTMEFLTPRRFLIAYLLAFVMPFIALGAQFWLTTHVNMNGPLVALFIIPALLASTFGGLWPGLLATIISVSLGDGGNPSPSGEASFWLSRSDL